MKTCCVAACAVLALLSAAVGRAPAGFINFETFSGPSNFADAGNAQALTIHQPFGNVVIQGGVILSRASNLPAANGITIYGTGNAAAIGVTTGMGLTNPISIMFDAPVTGFSLLVLNGNVQSVNYSLSDDAGASTSAMLAANKNGGNHVLSLGGPAASVFTIAATTGQSTPGGMIFDFFIDNISFSQADVAAPEPASLTLLLTGVASMLGYSWRRRKQAAPPVAA